jgi:6,7-dimethyl-8-ribityllumazine synthase
VATAGKHLSAYDPESIPNGADFKIGIVVSEWNDNITNNLCEGAEQALIANGVKAENILIHRTPGSFELPLGAQWMLQRNDIDGVVAIGSIIQGETKHFDFVCQATAQGVKDVGLKYDKPAIFCVLTDNNMQQAIDRSGGKHGNKGVEAALACLKMIDLKKNLK